MLHDDSDLKCICMATFADIDIYQRRRRSIFHKQEPSSILLNACEEIHRLFTLEVKNAMLQIIYSN